MSRAATYDVVKNGTPFQNPASSSIASTSTGSSNAHAKVLVDLAAVDAALVMDPTNPILLQEKADLEALDARFNVLEGGAVDPALPDQYKLTPTVGLSFATILTHTNYFSGVDNTPPTGFETTGVSFLSVLGAASATKTVAKELGETPADDPCKSINDLFGSVLGKIAEILEPLLSILNQFVNAVMTAANLLNLIDNFVNNIWQILNDEVNRLKEYLSNLLSWALSTFISSVVKDPCMAAVITAIATPALQEAIAEAPIIPS